ncbi:MAG: class II fructose-bisphosphate aldolase, partial [Eubacteriaceae bacterium]
MLVKLKQILKEAKAGNYAIGAFNTPNLEILQAV